MNEQGQLKHTKMCHTSCKLGVVRSVSNTTETVHSNSPLALITG